MYNPFKKRIMPVPINKGKVYIVTDTNHIVPIRNLQQYEVKKSTKQIEEESAWFESQGLKERPHDPSALMVLYKQNLQFQQAVNQIATDVAGNGWMIQLKEGLKENTQEQDKIYKLIEKPNETDSFRELAYAWCVDKGIIGDCAWEILRAANEDIAEILTLSTKAIKVYKDRKMYCQVIGTNKSWFARFGLRDTNGRLIHFNKHTGEEENLAFDDEKCANEIIFSKLRDPDNIYYGLSPAICVLGQMNTAIGIRDYNLSFFMNYGVPAYFVTLTGDWEDNAPATIQKFLDTELKGSENQHKTFVAKVPTDVTPDGSVVQGKIEFEPISVTLKEGSFNIYYKIVREDILSAFKVPPYRVGINETGSLGGSNIAKADEIYKAAVITPWQASLENIMTNMIFREGLKCESYDFKFSEMDTTDGEAVAKRHELYFNMGAITPNQIRNEKGEDPYNGGDVYYIKSGMIEVGYEEESDDQARKDRA